MKVFTDDFVNAVRGQLDKLEAGHYITREQLCVKIGVDARYMNAISIVLQDESFSKEFETVKSRGIRRIKK